MTLIPLMIELFRYTQRIGVQLEDRTKVHINLIDSSSVRL